MPKTMIDHIQGSELPAGWLEKTCEPVTQIFEVTLRPKKQVTPQNKPSESKWQKLIKRIEKERPFEGKSDELVKVSRQFRDCFILKEFDPLQDQDND